MVQYHEQKELTQELKMVVLRRAAEVAGEALGQRALEKNGIALAKADRDEEDTNLSNLILAGPKVASIDAMGRGRTFATGRKRRPQRSPASRADAIEGIVRLDKRLVRGGQTITLARSGSIIRHFEPHSTQHQYQLQSPQTQSVSASMGCGIRRCPYN